MDISEIRGVITSLFEGLGKDQIKFLVSMSFSCVFGFIMKNFIKPSDYGYKLRAILTFIAGIAMCVICYEAKTLHVIFSLAVSYAFMNLFSEETSFYLSSLFCFLHLSLCHMWRMYNDYGSYEIDITAPLMVMVQRITLMNASLCDGKILNSSNDDEKNKLSEIRKEHAIKQKPNILEFLAYMTSYQTILVGPLVPFHIHRAYLYGNEETLLKNDKEVEKFKSERDHVLSAKEVIFTMTKRAIIFGILYLIAGSRFPVSFFTSTQYQSYSFMKKITYLWSTAIFMRLTYYFAWNFCTVTCLISGLGFSGYNDDMTPSYKYVNSFNFKAVEFASSLKEITDNWNIPTLRWLRIVVFERSPKAYATLYVFFVSIFWHGFYPSYFVFFLSAAWLSAVNRLFRKKLRPASFQNFTNAEPPVFPPSQNWIERCPLYQKIEKSRLFLTILGKDEYFTDQEILNNEQKYNAFVFVYDFIGFISTFTAINYLAISFVLLTFKDSFIAWRNLFFFVHIIGLILHIALLKYRPMRDKKKL